MTARTQFNAPGRIGGVTLSEWAEATASALALAFGGHSQYTLRELAAAALGQRNNSGGRRPGRTEALMALAQWAVEQWSETTFDTAISELSAGWPVDSCGLPDEAGPLPEAWAKGLLTEDTQIATAIAQFPAEFGLRAFPELRFTISRAASFINDAGEVVLYTEVLRDGRWLAFAKGTVAELRREVVK